MRSLDPKCPEFGRKAITSQVGHCPEYYSVLPAFLNMFFSIIEVANARTAKWKLWRLGLEINTIFTTAVYVHVPKYVYGQHLYEEANVGRAKWKLWRVGHEK